MKNLVIEARHWFWSWIGKKAFINLGSQAHRFCDRFLLIYCHGRYMIDMTQEKEGEKKGLYPIAGKEHKSQIGSYQSRAEWILRGLKLVIRDDLLTSPNKNQLYSSICRRKKRPSPIPGKKKTKSNRIFHIPMYQVVKSGYDGFWKTRHPRWHYWKYVTPFVHSICGGHPMSSKYVVRSLRITHVLFFFCL